MFTEKGPSLIGWKKISARTTIRRVLSYPLDSRHMAPLISRVVLCSLLVFLSCLYRYRLGISHLDKSFAKVPVSPRTKVIKSEGHSRGAQFFSRHFSFFSQPSPFLGFFSRNEAASLADRQPSYDTRLHQRTKSVKDIR